MKPKWVSFFKLYKDGEVKLVRWVCLECIRACFIELPDGKDITHCLREEVKDATSMRSVSQYRGLS